MRSKLSLFLASIMMLTLFAFIGCGDDEPGTTNFDTQQEAMTAWNAGASSQMFIAYQLALTTAQQGISFSGDFDDIGGIFLKRTKGFRKFNTSMANGYQGNGLWIFDTTFTEEGSGDFDLHFELDFDQFDANGYPNAQTNTVDYAMNLAWDFSEVGEGTFIYNYDVDLNLTGIQGYRAETGNATLNGTAGFGINLETPAQQGQPAYDFEYSYSIKFNSIAIAPGDDAYPIESGSIEFTYKYGIDPNVQGFEEFNVKGKITFDGDNTAILEFGGFTFTLNLDTGDITPA